MSKQEKLISADKLLKWIDSEEASVLWEDPYGIEKYQLVIGEIKAGTFNPDPVPTIKPGDKVKYNGWQFKHIDTAMVNHLRLERFGTYASISHDKEYYIVPIDHLEVVRDE